MPNDPDVLFRTLADPTRRALFERLCREGEKTVGDLTARAGISQPAVSKHLGVLKQAGLVRDRHEGRQTHYSAQLSALAPLIDWTSQMAGFWQSRFDLGRCRLSGPGSRAEQNAVLHVGGLWSRECRHLDSHPYEHGDPPAHGAVGLPAGSAAGLPGRQGRVAAVLCKPGAGLGADRLKSAGTIQS